MRSLSALFPKSAIWLAVSLGLFCTLIVHGLEVIAEREVYLLVSVSTNRKGATYPKFVDSQGKFHGDRVMNITPGTNPHLVHVLMPSGQYQGVYFPFVEMASEISIHRAWIRNTAGTLNREIPLDYESRFFPEQQFQKLPDGGLSFHLNPDVKDQALALRMPGELFGTPPIHFIPGIAALLWGLAASGLTLAMCTLLAARGYIIPRDLGRLILDCPRRAIVIAGTTAAVLSILPVFTAQRGFVGSFAGTYLLYEAEATFPGQSSRIFSPSSSGVDIAAVTYAALGQMRQAAQHLYQDHEILLWDRFNNAGGTYLGQGMFLYLSPFIWIVLILGGTISSWTWAFVLAKLVFPGTMGLYLRRIGVSLPVALGTAVACGFVGSFIYRTGHFAFFVAAAFPLVMLGLDGLLEPGPKTWKRIPYLICWLLGSLACFSSGALKEGVFVMLSANGVALYLRLLLARNRRAAIVYLGLAALASIIFILITAPTWITFLASLKTYSTLYHRGIYVQRPVGAILSMFDEFFGRIYSNYYMLSTPGVNLLFLPGFVFAMGATCVSRRRLLELWPSVLGSVVCLCLIFSIIPGWLFVKVPFLGNVMTFYDTYGMCAIPLIIMASARGWDIWLGFDHGPPSGKFLWGSYGTLVAVVAVIVILPLQQAAKLNFPIFLCAGLGLLLMMLGAPWAIRALVHGRSRGWLGNSAISVALALICLACWSRYAYYSHISFEPWLYVLPERIDHETSSPSSDWVRAKVAVEPARVEGIDQGMPTGINTYFGLEGVGGPMPLWKPVYHYFLQNVPGGNVWQSWTFSVPFQNIALVAPYLEFLNCRYLFCMPGQVLPNGGPPLAHRSDMEVRELPLAWPRAFFVDRVEVVEDRTQLIGRIGKRTGPFCSVQSAEVTSHPELTRLFKPTDAPIPLPSFTPARDYHLTLNSTSFTAQATGPGVIVLHETFDPGVFKVTINGKRAEPILVNQMFRGLIVDSAGTYRVEYRYWPPGLTIGLWLSGAGLGLFIALCAAFLRCVPNSSDPRRIVADLVSAPEPSAPALSGAADS